jgi:hypothetical protein
MHRNFSWLAPYEKDLPTIFHEYLGQVTGLPLGSERLLWDRKALQEKDVGLEATNQRLRNQVFDAYWLLIDRFAQPEVNE